MKRNDYKIVLSKKAIMVYKKADQQFKDLLCKAVEKVLEHPNCGKPLKYEYKGLRSARIGHYRLIYEFTETELIIHNFEHRKRVYKP